MSLIGCKSTWIPMVLVSNRAWLLVKCNSDRDVALWGIEKMLGTGMGWTLLQFVCVICLLSIWDCCGQQLAAAKSFCCTAGTVHNLGLNDALYFWLKSERVWKASVDSISDRSGMFRASIRFAGISECFATLKEHWLLKHSIFPCVKFLQGSLSSDISEIATTFGSFKIWRPLLGGRWIVLLGDALITLFLAIAVGDEAHVFAACGTWCALFGLDFEPYCFMSIS